MDTPLTPEQLRHSCDLSAFGISSTADITPDYSALGQTRAMDAIQFAIGMEHQGYNLFVSGSTGVGKRELVSRIISAESASGEAPSDCCYIHNFERPNQPCVLILPQGTGHRLHMDLRKLIEILMVRIPAQFKSDEYRNQLQALNDEFQQREEMSFKALGKKAHELGITLLRTPGGYTLGPIRDGKLMTPDEFKQLPEEEREQIKRAIDTLNEELTELIHEVPKMHQEHQSRIRELEQETTRGVIDPALNNLRQTYGGHAGVLDFLDTIHQDLIENVDDFFPSEEEERAPLHKRARSAKFRRYQVNMLVSQNHNGGAPVVFEDIPSYQNLIGRIEYEAHFGTLTTDFSLIQPGALHRANGGYLVVDAQKLLTFPFAWEGLKRALRNRELRIDPLEKIYGVSGTRSLEPEPVPLDVRVILIGDRRLYYLLKQYDPEFTTLFKVYADFAEGFDRDRANLENYLGLITMLIREEGLAHFDLSALEAVVEHSSRQMDDSQKLSLNRGQLIDLLRESSFWALRQGASQASREHVHKAIVQQRYRSSQFSELLQEQIERGTLMISTSGMAIGQANGLAVYQLGDQRFGKPNRISATARMGSGRMLDIERETKLGGPVHSKGVMILAACIGSRYARNQPLSLNASLVFEQSYGPVDGDSASAVELCVLLSAICGLPLKQSFAVTGSINQQGEVQAIGGVNEKIEGFFELCEARGLDGSHGVIIPAANVPHLILDPSVVDACREGRFAIHAVSTLDQLIKLLFDRDAGRADSDGRYPPSTVNGMVQLQLADWAEQARKLNGKGDD
ncbi:Lon protease family protein [Marinobacterium sediminicola]|uniref:endopeptidase La n=1 Tax=Marinobacterium sediminicola TaxID=518898 RepID=A0ABY1S169_9GAMM|nr:ATP-binding protein [Marinobacterium sediminicola]ULG69778.1 AAA family ATPase [Marinobacterium sediminicola]SMR75411.1 lon-related putative ATP-dependent protease [Marinobacterium sediminicola]